MLYLVSQTALFILIAGLIGLWLGWYLGKLARDPELNQLQNQMRSQQRELSATQERAAVSAKQVADGAANLESAQAARQALEAEIAELRERLESSQPTPVELPQATAAAPRSGTSAPAAAEATTPETAVSSLPPAEGAPDDLQKIKGIGPRLSSLLNELGVYQYRQIAAFTPDDIAWVNAQLRFKGRIEREKWVEQAKALSASQPDPGTAA